MSLRVTDFKIAGRRFRFEVDDPKREYLTRSARIDLFSVPVEEEADLTIRCKYDLGPADEHWFRDGGTFLGKFTDYRIIQSADKRIFFDTSYEEMDAPHFLRRIYHQPRGIFQPDFTRGEIAPKIKSPELDRSPYYLDDLLLREYVVNRLALFGRAFLHSSQVNVNGRSVIFSAKSGTGKSTAGKMWTDMGYTLLNDECNAVFVENDTAMVSTTPFVGEIRYTRAATNPLAAIIFLNQGSDNRIVPVDPIAAYARVLSNGIMPRYYKPSMDHILQTIGDVTDRVPCFDIHCTPDFRSVRAVLKLLETL